MSKRGAHTSIDKDTKPEVEWLESLKEVRRVILDRHEVCRHKYSPGTLKYQSDTDNGIRIKAYTGNGVRSLFVIVEPVESRPALIKMIAERYESFGKAKFKGS